MTFGAVLKDTAMFRMLLVPTVALLIAGCGSDAPHAKNGHDHAEKKPAAVEEHAGHDHAGHDHGHGHAGHDHAAHDHDHGHSH